LVLGDIITIKHERLGIKIKAKIIAISYDFENGNISLTIANIEDVLTDEEKFITTLYNTVSTSTTVNINKDKWDKAEKVATEFDKYKNSAIETTKQKIIAGTNETVEISRRGLLIKNNDDPNKFIVQNSGVIAITDDGGQNWKIGISTNGIHAPLLIGDMIIGEKLKIINQNGKYTIDENGLTIDGGSLNIINGLPESQIDSNAVDRWNSAEENAKNYIDSQLSNYVSQTVYNQDIESLQNQIDGNITSWFYSHEPTLSNEPAIFWTTNNDKNNHLGDLFYNTTNGYCYRFAYENGQYKWILIKDSDVQKALADAAKAQDTADQKRRVFVNQPTPPYDIGDLWANGQKVYRCKIAKTSGQSFNSADWELVGDVTSQNTSNNTANVGNQPASTVATAVSNFNTRNDRKSTIPANPTIATDGTAIDHTINTDGSADISFEWIFNGSGDAYDIDGFIIYVFQSNSSSQYSFGTSASQEQVFYTTPDKRALILYGVPADRYYTFGIQAYRIVDQDINPSGILKSSIIKPSLTSENPYRPSANVAFTGNVTGTIAGESASAVVSKANNALQAGTLYNGVKIDTNSGLVITRSDNKIRTILNATDGIKIQSSNNGTNWTNRFYADTNGAIYANGLVIDGDSKFMGSLEGASGTFTGDIETVDPNYTDYTDDINYASKTVITYNGLERVVTSPDIKTVFTYLNDELHFEYYDTSGIVSPNPVLAYDTYLTHDRLFFSMKTDYYNHTWDIMSLDLNGLNNNIVYLKMLRNIEEIQVRNGSDNSYADFKARNIISSNGKIGINAGAELSGSSLKAKTIYSLYNTSKYMLNDHNNGNVSINAVGGELLLGDINTTNIKANANFIVSNNLTVYGNLLAGVIKVSSIRNTFDDSTIINPYSSGTVDINASQSQPLRLGVSGTSEVRLHTSTFRSMVDGDFYIRPYPGRNLRIADAGGTWRSVMAADFIPSSSEKWKTNITKYENSALSLINNSVIYQYTKDGSNDIEYGLIIERETPQEIISGDGIKSYSMLSLTWKAIQELSNQIDEMRSEIEMMKGV